MVNQGPVIDDGDWMEADHAHQGEDEWMVNDQAHHNQGDWLVQGQVAPVIIITSFVHCYIDCCQTMMKFVVVPAVM